MYRNKSGSGKKDVEIVKENIRISKSFSVALPMLNIIKILFLMTWQLYKYTTGKKKTMKKTI